MGGNARPRAHWVGITLVDWSFCLAAMHNTSHDTYESPMVKHIDFLVFAFLNFMAFKKCAT